MMFIHIGWLHIRIGSQFSGHNFEFSSWILQYIMDEHGLKYIFKWSLLVDISMSHSSVFLDEWTTSCTESQPILMPTDARTRKWMKRTFPNEDVINDNGWQRQCTLDIQSPVTNLWIAKTQNPTSDLRKIVLFHFSNAKIATHFNM